MRFIAFNFGKISAERFKEKTDTLKFNMKIDISSIEPIKSDIIKTKEDLLKIEFVYAILYEPEFAKIEFTGSILLAVESRIAREVLRDWKEKETSEDFRVFMFNIILRKSNIRALQLEDELGLPPHMPMPSLNKDNISNRENISSDKRK